MTTKLIPQVNIARLVGAAGWTGYEAVHVVQAVLAENGGDAYALYVNTDDSVDVGLFSLNTHWIPEPTLAERLDPARAVVYAKRSWDQWWTRRDVLVLPDYNQRLTYILNHEWHATMTPRYGAAFPAAVDACRTAGVI